MYIKEFYIDNFRGYKKFKLHANKDLNLLTGLNNCGKTTPRCAKSVTLSFY